MNWISVKDRMPEEEDIFLTIDITGEMEILLFSKHNEAFMMLDDCGYEWPTNYVTHWMPLPEPPEAEDA